MPSSIYVDPQNGDVYVSTEKAARQQRHRL